MPYHDTVHIPKKEFIKEHRQLIKLLDKGDRKQLKQERMKQAKELSKVLKTCHS